MPTPICVAHRATELTGKYFFHEHQFETTIVLAISTCALIAIGVNIDVAGPIIVAAGKIVAGVVFIGLGLKAARKLFSWYAERLYDRRRIERSRRASNVMIIDVAPTIDETWPDVSEVFPSLPASAGKQRALPDGYIMDLGDLSVRTVDQNIE